MTRKQDTSVYRLKDGRETVYIGTSNDVAGRAQQHESDGKKFTRVEPASRKMTDASAKKREAKMLDNYRSNHGKNPRYNKSRRG